MEKSAHWAFVAAVFAASIVGCGLQTGPNDERVAGDGVLPSNESPPSSEAPPGTTPGSPSGGAPAPEQPPPAGPAPTTPPTPGTKIIFVTSAKVYGRISVSTGGGGAQAGVGGIQINLPGGQEGGESKTGREAADLICAQEAKEAKLPGTYLAWLSNDEEDAIARIPENAGGWSFPTGQLVFPNRAHIAAGNGPLRQLLVLANGWWVGSNADAWTSTMENGKRVSQSCNRWQSTSGTGVSGSLYYMTGKWTNNTADLCSSQRRLICFQSK